MSKDCTVVIPVERLQKGFVTRHTPAVAERLIRHARLSRGIASLGAPHDQAFMFMARGSYYCNSPPQGSKFAAQKYRAAWRGLANRSEFASGALSVSCQNGTELGPSAQPRNTSI